MNRLIASLKQWSIREASSIPLYFVLLLPVKPRRWYWSALDFAAKPITSRPELASSLFAMLQSRRWIRQPLKNWLHIQQAFAQARLGRFDEACDGFTRITSWDAPPPLKVLTFRAALASFSPGYSSEQYFTLTGHLAYYLDVPVSERATLLIVRGAHFEHQAEEAAKDSHAGSEAKMGFLRKAFADYDTVLRLPGLPPELHRSAISGQVSTALSGVDFNSAYRVSMDARHTAPIHWRRTLARHAQLFPQDCMQRYQEFARSELRSPSAPSADAYCWLMNIAYVLSQADRMHATNAALRLAAKHGDAWEQAPAESRWNIVTSESFGIELADPGLTVAIPFESLVALLAPDRVPANVLPQLDEFLLGTNIMGTDPVAALGDAVDMLSGTGLSRSEAVAACEAIVLPAGHSKALEAIRSELSAALHIESVQRSIPQGLSKAGLARVTELLVSIEKASSRKRDIRSALEEIGEHVMDVTPVESKIDALAWLARLSLTHECGDHAESSLHAARSTCMRYESPPVRLQLLLRLCYEVRRSSLRTSFESFYKSIALEGRTLAAQTWIHASGYYEKDRVALKNLQAQFEDIL